MEDFSPLLPLLRKLQDAHVHFVLHWLRPGGYHGGELELSPEDIVEFTPDFRELVAQAHGVTEGEFMWWLVEGWRIQCEGTTRKGRRCENSVLGTFDTTLWTPQQWIRRVREGGYCHLHGGA